MTYDASMGGPLTGKVALVSGGGSGIGEAITRALVADGAAVVITGRRREVLDRVVGSLTEGGAGKGVRALAVAGDVSRPEDCERMVETAVEELGALHILVNNAGIAEGGGVEDHGDDAIDALIDIDLKGPIHLLRAALPHLRGHREQGGALVLNISSSVASTVLSKRSVYSAAKAGLDQLTRCWALDLAPHRIRVNAIAPGIVDTPIFDTVLPTEAARAFLRHAADITPLGRVGQPEDIAQMARFLVSPAAEWITGVVIPVDGGISLAGDV